MAISTILNFARDVNGYNTFGPQFTLNNQSIKLTTGGGEKTVTVPDESPSYLVIFGYQSGAPVWVANNATATLPGSSFAATASQCNPTARWVNAGDVLHFITDDTSAEVGISFYPLKQN